MKFERQRGKNIGGHRERLGIPKTLHTSASALPRRSSAPSSPTNGNEPQILTTTRRDMILTSHETPLAARDAKGCKGWIKGSSSCLGSDPIRSSSSLSSLSSLSSSSPSSSLIILIILLQSPSISLWISSL